MKNPKPIFLAFTAFTFLAMVITYASNNDEKYEIGSSDNSYSLVLNNYGDVTSGKQTDLGNEINFSYSSLSSSTGMGSLNKNGYIYNSTKISGIKNINVSLTSGDINIWYGSSTSSWTSYTHGNSYDLTGIYPNYFKIEALSNSVIGSITINYSCVDYQQESENINYSMLVNDAEVSSIFINQTGSGNEWIAQYKMTLDVYAGDLLSFYDGNTRIYPDPSSGDNNVYHDGSRGYLAVKDTMMNTDLYLKIYNDHQEVWLFGYGNSYQESDIQDGTILQAFNWSANTIRNNLSAIKDAGYRAVQISPMQPQNGYYDGGLWTNEAYKLYQPLGFKISGSNESVIGTRSDLINLCNSAKAMGIDIVVDIVLNHLGGPNNYSFAGGVNNYESEMYNHQDTYIHKNVGYVDDNSVQKMVQGYMGDFPDIKTENAHVQSRALALVKDYLDCGVTGFRFDAAKHIETPFDGATYSSSFWPIIVNGAKRYAKEKGYDVPYCYGEILGLGIRSFDSYKPYMSVTDHSQSYDVRDAATNNNTSKLNNNYYSGLGAGKSVIWAESHDTFQHGETSSLTEEQINKVYAIQASRSDASTLYVARPNANTNMREVGTTYWKDAVVAAANKFHNRFVGQGEYFVTGGSNGCMVNVRGSGEESGAMIVKINNGNSSVNVNVPNMANGTYIDLISEQTYTVNNNYVTVSFTNDVCVLVPSFTTSYYIVGNTDFTGTSSSWTTESGLEMSKGGGNLAYLENVDINANSELKIVKKYSNSDTLTWYGTLGAEYDFCSIVNDNIKFPAAGNFSFFLNVEGLIYIVKNGEDPVEETSYYLMGSFNSWTQDDNYLLTQDGENDNHYYINDVTLAAGATLKILSSDDVWYSNASTWTGCGFTLENGNVKVTNAGTYNIDFYVESDYNNHIVLTAQGQPDPEVYTYTINVVIPSGWGISDIYDGGAKVYVWAWGGTYGGGAWVTTTKVSANKLTVDIDDTVTAFKVVRLSNTTTTPTWDNKWNESKDEIVPSSGVYTYSTTLQ